MSVRVVRMACIALVLGTACIRPSKTQPVAKPETQDDESEARAALGKARKELDAGHAREARQLTDAALTRRVSAKTRAELLTLAAESSWDDPEADKRADHEAALAAWEAIPGSDEQVAEALVMLAMLIEDYDFPESERAVLRAISIRERLHGPDHEILQIPFALLIDIYDQQCRVAELERTLERLAHVVAAHPKLSSAAFYVARSRAVIDRRLAKLDAAMDGMQKALDASDPNDRGRPATAVLLADYARETARYSDHLRFLEQSPEFHGEHLDRHNALRLHFAYVAIADPRRAAHAEKYRILVASAGEELFPTELPPIEACVPITGQRNGWLFKVDLDDERLKPCFNSPPARSSPADTRILTLMRVGQGRVVAAQAAGIDLDEKTLDCVAHTAIGIEVPGPHDFNFVSDIYLGE